MSKLSDQFEKESKKIEDAARARDHDLLMRRTVVYKDIVRRIKVHIKANPPEAGKVFDFEAQKLAGWIMNRPQVPDRGPMRSANPSVHADMSPSLYFLENGEILINHGGSIMGFNFVGHPSMRWHVFGLLHGFACDHGIYLGHGTEYEDWSALYDNPPAIERRHWWQSH